MSDARARWAASDDIERTLPHENCWVCYIASGTGLRLRGALYATRALLAAANQTQHELHYVTDRARWAARRRRPRRWVVEGG